jgi:hypothetical protein
MKVQQMSPGWQQLFEPQQSKPAAQGCPPHGIGPHLPPPQNESGGLQTVPHPPQFCGSLRGSMQVTPLQHSSPGPQVGQLPPELPLDEPLADEPLLEEVLPEPEPLLDAPLVEPLVLPELPLAELPLDADSADASAPPLGLVEPPQRTAIAAKTTTTASVEALGMAVLPAPPTVAWADSTGLSILATILRFRASIRGEPLDPRRG